MRILHIITLSNIGGAQTVVIELANHAVSEGHEVAVLSLRGGAMWGLLDSRVVQLKTGVFRRNLDPIRDILALLAVQRAYAGFHPNIVHLHSSKAGVWGRVGLPLARKKLIYTVHGFDTILKSNKVFLPLEQILSARCAAVVAVSDYDRQNLEKHKIKAKSVILNGVEAVERREYIALRGIRDDGAKYRVCALARLAPPKRFDIFIETARLLGNKGFAFYWIGNQEKVSGLPDNVRCLGEIPNARTCLASFDLLMLPSDYEGLPMCIIEALSAGLPVVASRVGGIPEVLDGKNGFAAENEPKAMADAILRLTGKPGDYESASIAARKSFEERFSAGRMWFQYRKLYEEIVARNKRRHD